MLRLVPFLILEIVLAVACFATHARATESSGILDEITPGGVSSAEAAAFAAPRHDFDSRDYYVDSRGYGTRRETEPPRYVTPFGENGLFGIEDAQWLDFGLDYRMRYEYRNHDLRRPVGGLDQPILSRTRAFIGIREILDPFRFVFEFEDARRYNSRFPRDTRDVNQFEFIQMLAELRFEDALGVERPLRLQAGRMAFEYLDRRLIARNDWRNTTGNFQGFRSILGQESNDWQLDLLAVQPILIRMDQFDRVDHDRWFFAAIGHWRRWSEIVTLQPYYLLLDQDEGADRPERNIHSIGLRGYGIVDKTGFDYDFDAVLQFGRDSGNRHRAFGVTSEVGYVWEAAWKPRASAFLGYATGDRHPDDDTNQRFDRLFGFRRPWSANDYFGWDNIIAPKARLELRPHRTIRADLGYGAFWLASATDSWRDANRRDPTGQSGDFLGHEFDLRVRWNATPRTEITLGYAHFSPGEFTKNTGRSNDTDFFYVQTSIKLSDQ